jgi:hypothetical protein
MCGGTLKYPEPLKVARKLEEIVFHIMYLVRASGCRIDEKEYISMTLKSIMCYIASQMKYNA